MVPVEQFNTFCDLNAHLGQGWEFFSFDRRGFLKVEAVKGEAKLIGGSFDGMGIGARQRVIRASS